MAARLVIAARPPRAPALAPRTPARARTHKRREGAGSAKAKRGFDGDANPKADTLDLADVEPVEGLQDAMKPKGWSKENVKEQDNTIYFIMAGSVALVVAIIVGIGSSTGVIDKSRWDRDLEARTGYDLSSTR